MTEPVHTLEHVNACQKLSIAHLAYCGLKTAGGSGGLLNEMYVSPVDSYKSTFREGRHADDWRKTFAHEDILSQACMIHEQDVCRRCRSVIFRARLSETGLSLCLTL